MGKRMGIALIGGAAAATLVLGGCASSNSGKNNSESPTASPSSSTSASPITKTLGSWQLTLTPGGELPAGWPGIPAPNNGTLQATGTAGHAYEPDDEKLLAAQYMAPGMESTVEAAQTKQMLADGWGGGKIEHGGAMQFEKGHTMAYIVVVGNASTGGVTVYQWTPGSKLPKADESAGASASAQKS